MPETIGVIGFLVFIYGIGKAIRWSFKKAEKEEKKPHLQQAAVFAILGFLTFVIFIPKDSQPLPAKEQPTEQAKQEAGTVPKPASFEKLEHKFLMGLRDLDISPEVSVTEKGKTYSTKFCSLVITNYPSTNEAAAFIVPVSDSNVDNLKSFALVGTYVKTVVNEDAASKLIPTITESLTKHKKRSFTLDNFKITVEPPDKDAGIPMIVITTTRTTS